MKLLPLISLFLVTPCLAGLPIIYGEDNRHEVYEYPDAAIRNLAKSTVALIPSKKIMSYKDKYFLALTTMEETMRTCAGERFSEQPTPAFCSGFLIAPDKIVTAGHCITKKSDCDDTHFVFDFALKASSKARTELQQSQVYRCKKVLGQKLEQKGIDYAVIQLDRRVMDRTPLKLSKNTGLKLGAEVVVIGNPSGLPTKITDMGKVRKVVSNLGYFVTNLDTYGGNSGSAVFNSKTLEVEGILVRGGEDFVKNQGCQRSNHVGENSDRGEDVTLITKISENGFEHTPVIPVSPSGQGRHFVWSAADSTCILFDGTRFLGRVSNRFCGK